MKKSELTAEISEAFVLSIMLSSAWIVPFDSQPFPFGALHRPNVAYGAQ